MHVGTERYEQEINKLELHGKLLREKKSKNKEPKSIKKEVKSIW